MIRLETEKIIALDRTPEVLRDPDGRTFHRATAFRWAACGVIGRNGQRVFLETIRLGGRRYTSLEALQRFADALTHSKGSRTTTDATAGDRCDSGPEVGRNTPGRDTNSGAYRNG